MRNVLVFAGTTEGRELVEAFDRSNVKCHVCVATEYGSQVLKASENIVVHTGRLDEAGMKKLMGEIKCDIVVDATHPYAVMVTSVIKNSIEGMGIEYIRLLRDGDISGQRDALVEDKHTFFYDSVEECATNLSCYSGNILLTTGSKQLATFTSVPEIKERLVARVIPGMESLKLCYDAGLEGKQIIAMQGPFSQEMNETIIKEYGIEHLVTKESGMTGGVDEKIAAAKKLGIKLHVIKRPEDTATGTRETGLSMGETISRLEKLLDVTFDKGKMNIILAGIGPGSDSMMTKEVGKAILEADVIFGARRMIDSINCKANKYPYYLKSDILPVLNEIENVKYKDKNIVILFSGDTGFFSGCKKMYEALCDKKYNVKVLPGISSIAVLSARIGTSWEDGNIISLHGVEKEQWFPKLLDSVCHFQKTFFISSGVKDINQLGEILEKNNENYEIHLGYQLSYPEEEIIKVTPSECKSLTNDGLYVGLIVSKEIAKRYLVPTLNDDYFIRDKVPMTKEDVRKLSICQMNIKEDDIVYDIGSGSGSIAVQCGLLSPSIEVYALECNPDAVNLIKKNVEKAGLNNITVIETMAPAGLDELKAANVAFIGGSKGNLKEILLRLNKINPSMRVVINAVSIETICEINGILKEMNICELSIKQLAVSEARKLGDYHMLSANNPIYIFAFNFAGESNEGM